VVKEQTELAELEATRREKELLATTIKPAEAERMAAIVRAEGARQAAILAAEAHARQLQLTGEAEGAAILARGQAEAKAKELLADAYRKFDEAAVLLQTLPLVPPIVRGSAGVNLDALAPRATRARVSCPSPRRPPARVSP